jgi:hypothetical protein
VSGPARLEQRYRRLLAWYPTAFRRDQAEEMLAVLMAGAPAGRRRPRPAETIDVLRSALGMRARRAVTALRPAAGNQRWADALALFSFAAPVLLVIVAILEVALPYHLPPPGHFPAPAGYGPRELGGLSLLRAPFLAVAGGLQLIVAAFAVAGWRRLTLAAMGGSAVYWIGYRVTGGPGISLVPDALQLLTAGAYLLGTAALLASPGPHRGRQLMTGRVWAILLSAAAFAQVSTLLLDATSPVLRFWGPQPPHTQGYLVASAVLAALTVILAVALRLSRPFLLFLAAMFYPYVMQLASSGAFSAGRGGTNLLRIPTPGHLALLFIPPALLAGWATLTALWPGRSRAMTTPEQEA